MRIFFNRIPRNEPYGGGNQFLVSLVKELENRGHEVVYHLQENLDLIFIMDPRVGDIGYGLQHVIYYKNQYPDTRIIHRVNECDKRKNTVFMDDLLLKTMSVSSDVIFISRWLQDYFKKIGFSRESHIIYNGCDSSSFYPVKKDFNSNKIKLVTHHWSDNWMKGFDLYTGLDKHLLENENSNFELTYIGRYNKEYIPKNTVLVSPTHGLDLGNQLRNHDIYVTASRFEPCGMHHVEGSACGLPVIYHENGGGINELCKNHGESFNSLRQFFEKLDIIANSYQEYVDKIDHEFLSIDRCIKDYVKIIERSA